MLPHRPSWLPRTGCFAGMTGWPLWRLRPLLRGYVLTVITSAAAAVITAATLTHWQGHDLLMDALLLVFGAITVETIRRAGEPATVGKDAHGLWELAIAVLLPPIYALTAPIAWVALSQWRVRRTLPYRRVFTAAAVGLSYGAASMVFHLFWRPISPALPGPPGRMATWAALAAGSAVLRWVINNTLVLTAIRLDDPATRARELLGGGDGLYNDVAELCVGVIIAYCAATSPLLLVLALPCGTVLQRSARHAQLLRASRTDAKTGLLSASAWQREAAVHVARAQRTGTPLAAAMVDIDHFKAVNDTYGHLAGDDVIASVAGVLRDGMREYDLAGRFGGEEFSVLLPHTHPDDAFRIAERLREALSQVLIPASPAPGTSSPPHITASIGVATLTGTMTDLTDLLATADTALYQAKQAGRNTVRTQPPSPQPATLTASPGRTSPQRHQSGPGA